MPNQKCRYRWTPIITRHLVPSIYYVLGILIGLRGFTYLLAHRYSGEAPWIDPSRLAENAIGYDIWGLLCLVSSVLIIAGVYFRARPILMGGAIVALAVFAGLSVASLIAVIQSGNYGTGHRSVIVNAQGAAIWAFLLYATFISGGSTSDEKKG